MAYSTPISSLGAGVDDGVAGLLAQRADAGSGSVVTQPAASAVNSTGMAQPRRMADVPVHDRNRRNHSGAPFLRQDPARDEKSEIRNSNPKQIQNPKPEGFVSKFGASNLFRISDFDFRI
jgi:hypothetical protein